MTAISTGFSASTPPITTALYTSYIPTPVPDSIAQAQIMRASIDEGQGDTKRFVQIPLAPIFPNAIGKNSTGNTPFTPSYYNRDVALALFAQSSIIDVTAVITSQINWIFQLLKNQEISTVRTEDFIVSSTLAATANTIYASGGTNGDSPTNMSSIDANNICGALKNENAPMTTSIIEGTTSIGTTPQKAGYTMLTSSVAIASFFNDSTFTQVADYSDPKEAIPGEQGAFGTLRIICSTDWPVYTNGLSLNGNPILQGSITSVQSYVLVMHSSMYRRIAAVGSGFYGANMLQTGTSAQSYFGSAIVQPSWVFNILYTAI